MQSKEHMMYLKNGITKTTQKKKDCLAKGVINKKYKPKQFIGQIKGCVRR